jgi:methyl-accepting chemotaxis protein
MQTVEEAIEALDGIAERVEDANTGVQSINEATDDDGDDLSWDDAVVPDGDEGDVSDESAAGTDTDDEDDDIDEDLSWDDALVHDGE